MKTEPETFIRFCLAMGLPAPTPELKFHPVRKWRFDYAWEDAKVFLEVEGGVWSGGRHTNPKGFKGDMAKYNAATCMGWRKLSCTPKDLLTLTTITLIKTARCA